MSSHLAIHLQLIDGKNMIRILAVDRKVKYLEEYKALYPDDIFNQSDNLFFHYDEGKWNVRLKNDLEFKKFKEFNLVKKNDLFQMVLKKEKDYNDTNKILLGLYKSVFLNFVNNKINSYNEDENDENDEDDDNAQEKYEKNHEKFNLDKTSFIQNLEDILKTEGPININEYIDTYYESSHTIKASEYYLKENTDKKGIQTYDDVLQYDPNMFVKINKFKFKCIEKIDDKFFYLSKHDLYSLLITYCKTSPFYEFQYISIKEPTNLIIKGNYNYKLSINQDYIEREDIPYLLNYLNLVKPHDNQFLVCSSPIYQIKTIVDKYYPHEQIVYRTDNQTNKTTEKVEEPFPLTPIISKNIEGFSGFRKTLGYASIDNHMSNSVWNYMLYSEVDTPEPKKTEEEASKTIYFYKNTITNYHFIINFKVKYFNEMNLIYEMGDNNDKELLHSLVKSLTLYDNINMKTINKIKSQIDTFLEILNLIIEDESDENKPVDKNSKQTHYTSQYVNQFKDDTIETIASQVNANVNEYLSHFLPEQNININQIGKDLVSLNVKKNRKSAGYFYGIKKPNQTELLELVNKNKNTMYEQFVRQNERNKKYVRFG